MNRTEFREQLSLLISVALETMDNDAVLADLESEADDLRDQADAL